MANMHKEASYFLLENYVYIFGGYNIAAKTGQKLMSRYDVTNDVWQTVGQMSNGMTGVGCCMVDLPWFVLESEQSSPHVYEDQQQQSFDRSIPFLVAEKIRSTMKAEEDLYENEDSDNIDVNSDDDNNDLDDDEDENSQSNNINSNRRNQIDTNIIAVKGEQNDL